MWNQNLSLKSPGVGIFWQRMFPKHKWRTSSLEASMKLNLTTNNHTFQMIRHWNTISEEWRGATLWWGMDDLPLGIRYLISYAKWKEEEDSTWGHTSCVSWASSNKMHYRNATFKLASRSQKQRRHWLILLKFCLKKTQILWNQGWDPKSRDDVKIRAPQWSLSSMNGNWWNKAYILKSYRTQQDIPELRTASQFQCENNFPGRRGMYPNHRAVSIVLSFLLCCLVVFQSGSIRHWKLLPVVAGVAKQQRQSVAAARTPETLHQRECV